MKLIVSEDGQSTLTCQESEFKCRICTVEKNLYYCEQNKKVYCNTCIKTRRACTSIRDHEDIKINRVIFGDEK